MCGWELSMRDAYDMEGMSPMQINMDKNPIYLAIKNTITISRTPLIAFHYINKLVDLHKSFSRPFLHRTTYSRFEHR